MMCSRCGGRIRRDAREGPTGVNRSTNRNAFAPGQTKPNSAPVPTRAGLILLWSRRVPLRHWTRYNPSQLRPKNLALEVTRSMRVFILFRIGSRALMLCGVALLTPVGCAMATSEPQDTRDVESRPTTPCYVTTQSSDGGAPTPHPILSRFGVSHHVEIGTLQPMELIVVSPIGSHIDAVSIPPRREPVRITSGAVSYDNITLAGLLPVPSDIKDWFREAVEGRVETHHMRILLFGGEGSWEQDIEFDNVRPTDLVIDIGASLWCLSVAFDDMEVGGWGPRS